MSTYDPSSAIVTGFAPFVGYVPAVVGAAIVVGLALWGTKKLVGLFKSLAK